MWELLLILMTLCEKLIDCSAHLSSHSKILVMFNYKLAFLTPHVAFFLIQHSLLFVEDRGGVEDTTFEGKANETKKIRDQGKRLTSRGLGQECSKPRTQGTSVLQNEKKRSSREEMPIFKVKRKKLIAMAYFQRFNVLGREQGVFEDLQASKPKI